MLQRVPANRRHAAAAVEFALVLPALLFVLIGLVVCGLGVFRYHQVNSLSREGARWASVRGAQYEKSTGKPAATPQDVYNNAILPMAIGLDPSHITYSVTWDPDNNQGNMVIVTVNYHWVPEAYFGGMTLSSTSKMPVSY